ncbi:MAG: UDP-3-O-acyl-N-acetylglucosamine deacetylase [Candidatus Melainabacteria bacterium]|nr:UDP-3-O-acyl-N-acetylglucosamine deacetylase [Candidatus Melainabacteria bacterium]
MPVVPMPENKRAASKQADIIASFSGRGLTSKQAIQVDLKAAPKNSGITFNVLSTKTNSYVEIGANANNVVNTLRNVVLGKDGTRLCIVEHFLAAATLWGLEDLDVTVAGPEMPLGDGSAQIWTDLFEKAGLKRNTPTSTIELKEPIVLTKGDRSLLALPDTKFSVHYMMDWNHPCIGKRWQSWEPSQDPSEITIARTFGMLKDHQMLGLENDVISLTADGFTMPLHFEDEPVRHKLLDLVGDLALCGINPLKIKAKFISIKGGHEIDVEMAKRLSAILPKVED